MRWRSRDGHFGRFLLVLLLFLAESGRMAAAKRKLVNIFWNTTNPMFRIDNTDNVIDINRGNLPWEYDQANVICPVYPRGTPEDEMEQYIIYSVSKEEYDECRIFAPDPKVVAVCNKPHELLYVTITFRSFTPTPGGLEFEPGKDYFFISTSSQRDLRRRIGGRCSTHNMRATFKVAASAHGRRPWEFRPQRQPSRQQQQQQQNFTTTVNVPRSFDSHNRRSDHDVLDLRPRQRPQQRRPPHPLEEEVQGNGLDVGGDEDGRRRRMPYGEDEDVVKQEASVMHPGVSSSSTLSPAKVSFLVSLSVLLLCHKQRTLRTLVTV